MVKIPKNIILTWKDKNIPSYVFDNHNKLNLEFKILFFTDKDIVLFLNKYYGHSYVKFFEKIPFGRYKADFFRYCYLYKKGGFYLDIDIEPIIPIRSFFKKETTFFSVLSTHEGHIFQAVLFSQPNSYIIKMCIDSMLKYGSNIGIDPPDVFPFTGHPTKCMYENLEIFLRKKPNAGKNIYKKEQIELAEEKKRILGRYAVYYKGKKIFYSRYSNYKREKGFIK